MYRQPRDFLEEIAVHFANGDENVQQTDEETSWQHWTPQEDEKLCNHPIPDKVQ